MRGTTRSWALILAAALVLSGGAFESAAATTYLQATFESAQENTGSGPLAVAGPWDPNGVEIGTAGVINENPAECSAWVTPSAGLGGTSLGLAVADVDSTPAASVLPWFDTDPSVAGPTATSTYWIEYRFRIDPAATDQAETSLELFGFDDVGGNHRILRSWHGWWPLNEGVDDTPQFRYALFDSGGSHKAVLGPIDATDEWRIMIKVDPVAGEQTHWLWKNGNTVEHAMLGVAWPLLAPQTQPLERLRFQTHRSLRVGFVVDEVEIFDTGPPPAPSALEAVPAATDQVSLTWADNSTTETEFVVQRSLDGVAGWSDIATLPADTTAHVDGGLTSGVKYYYRVAARNAGGTSPWSSTTWAVTVYTGKPLSDWLVVTDFGAVGSDGQDDTEAIQVALSALVGWWGQGGPDVLFFPDGVYEVSETLFLEGTVGIQIVGESTDGTVLEWHGPAGTFDGSVVDAAVMFHHEGNKHATYRNLTWDGRDVPYIVAFDQSWCGNGPNYNPACDGIGNSWYTLHDDVGVNDTASGHFDSVFKNAWVGLRIGHFNVQDDEVSVRRCRFLDNAAGVSIEDFNALQEQFWDCEFSGNERAITNVISTMGGASNNWAGDFRVLRGRFTDNDQDIYFSPTGHFTFRECWSKGSGQFLFGHGQTSTSCQITMLGNRIDDFDPADQFQGRAVDIRNSGPLLMIDNAIDTSTPQGTRDEPIYASTWNWTDVLALHNDYTTADPYQGPKLKLKAIDDEWIAPFDLTIPPLPSVIDHLETRPIFTVTDAANLQEVLDVAGAWGVPAVVHLPSGVYPIEETLLIPAGSDLMITGNGSTTELRWAGSDDGPMVEIDGHQVDGLVLRDLLFRAENVGGVRATAIRVHDLNQENSRVLMHRLLITHPESEGVGAGIEVDGCDRVKVDAVDMTLHGTDANDNVGMRVQAGPQEQEAKAVWTGTVLGNGWDFDVVNNVNGVKMLVSSTYMEDSSGYLRARGAGGPGDVSVHGGKASLQDSTNTAAYLVDDFSGNVSIVSDGFFDFDSPPEGARLEQTGSSPVNIQMMANTTYWEPEYDVGASAYVVRVSEKYNCLPVHSMDPNLDPMFPPYPPCGPVDTHIPLPDHGNFPADEPLLDDGLHLLRTLEMPGHYDEPGAQETYQLNLDNVHIWDPVVGVELLGGIPGDPSALSATPLDPTRVDLDWTDGSTDEDGFDVQRSLDAQSGFIQVATTGPDQATESDTTVLDGTRYYYRVAAFRQRTGYSAWTNTAEAIAPVAPPAGLIAVAEGVDEIVLAWTDASQSEAGFHVERRLLPAGGFAGIATLPADTFGFMDDGLTPGTSYEYRVLAFNAVAGDSAWSNAASATTEALAPGPAAELRVGRAGGEALDLNFDAAACATDHVAYWSLHTGGLSVPPTWTDQACGLGPGAAATIDPGSLLPGQWVAFVVVGNNGFEEGSYGRDSSQAERAEASGLATCDYPQDLVDACGP